MPHKLIYSPRTLLKLYLYGHMNRIRSFRMLERECGRNIELWRLLDKLRPDHNTIAIFRAMNRKAVLKVFRLFVRLWAELRLCGAGRACVDGTTIRAVNGMDLLHDTADEARKNLGAEALRATADKGYPWKQALRTFFHPAQYWQGEP